MSIRIALADRIQGLGGEAQPVVLPITRDLKPAYTLSLIVALFMSLASVAGLVYQRTIYPTEELLLAFVPSDAFNLAVGLPLLLGSMWLARRGALAGLLSWPGALFYVLYMYIPYVRNVPFNLLFLPYLALVTLSAYTLIGIIASIDGDALRRNLTGFVPARLSAGVLIGLAAFIIVRQTARILAALAGQTPLDTLEMPSWIADFTVVIPMLLVVGIQLWRRQALGYAGGAGLLLGYGLSASSLSLYFRRTLWLCQSMSPVSWRSWLWLRCALFPWLSLCAARPIAGLHRKGAYQTHN